MASIDNTTDEAYSKLPEVGNYYPLRIKLWRWVHYKAEALSYWVWRTRLKPYFDATRKPLPPPHYREVGRIEATPEERAKGITHKVVYRG